MTRLVDKHGRDTRPKIRVAVSLPAGDMVSAGFAYDLARMTGHTAANHGDVQLMVNISQDTILPRQRHELVCLALKQDATHMLWLDSDMRFPKTTLARLLEHKEPIVAANYTRRRYPPMPVATTLDGNLLFVETHDEGLVEAAHVGMGCMLVDMDVFKKMPAPWFSIGYAPNAASYVGEDVFFCYKTREMGLKILLDATLSREVSHVGSFEFRNEHALLERDVERQGATNPA